MMMTRLAALTAATVLAAAAAVAVAAAPVSAAAAPVRHAGLLLSYKGGTDWMGSYESGGKVVVCLTPAATLATPGSWHDGTVGTPAQTAKVSYIMDTWGASSGNTVAAAARDAMLQVLGRLGAFPGLKVPAAVAALAKTYLADAVADAGPYKASLTLTARPAAPGPGGTAVLSVTSASGHRLNGLAARFSASGAVTGASGRTGAPVAFTRTLTTAVRVSGSAKVSAGDLLIGSAGAGFQVLAAGLTTTVAASAAYSSRPGAPALAVSCQCTGAGNVTATLTAAARTDEGQYTAYVNGRAAAVAVLPAGARTGVLKVTAPDGAVITVTARYAQHPGGTWGAPVTLGAPYTVICAAAPVLTVTCQCAVTLTLASPLPAGSPYTENLRYTVAGVTRVVPVPAGGHRTVTFTLASGQFTYSADVTRAGKVIAATPVLVGGFA